MNKADAFFVFLTFSVFVSACCFPKAMIHAHSVLLQLYTNTIDQTFVFDLRVRIDPRFVLLSIYFTGNNTSKRFCTVTDKDEHLSALNL